MLLGLASCSPPQAPPRLLLLVSVDTLRADRLGAYGSERGLTPRLDALAAESELFQAAYAPSSHTLPSMSALLTGRYPQSLGISGNLSVLPETTPTLATRLRAEGWNTAAVVSNWILRRESGMDLGFQTYDDTLPQLEATRPMPERIAEDTTDAALRALDACLPDPDARCFLWVHYQDPHGPYTPPEGSREPFLERERAAPDGRRTLPLLRGSFGLGGIPDYQYLGPREVAFYRAGYDAEVAYLDRELGRLLEGLAARDLAAGAVIVFVADHGESLGEDGYWFGHGELLSEPLVRVPLLLRVPGRPARERSDLASLVDLVPTLMELLTGRPDPAPGAGRPLLAPGAESRSRSVLMATLQGSDVPRLGLVEGDFKYVVTLEDGVWHGRLTARGRDEVDLTAPAPQVAARMRGQLMDRLEELQPEASTRKEPSPEDRTKLEALGYLDPSDPR